MAIVIAVAIVIGTITTIVAATGTINTAIGTPAIATAMSPPTRGTETTTIRIADSDACGYEKRPVRSRSDGQRTQGTLY
jgi:hypothetical protein